MKSKKGFTLIELMVAMGIIAVLVTMSVIAIQIVQQNLRNTQRRDVVNTVRIWAVSYFNDNGQFPLSAQISFGTTNVTFTGTNPATEITKLNGATKGATTTTNSQTDYCYVSTGGSFQLGARLEGGSEVQLGDGGNCTAWGT